jgi:glyoxylase-like metal-dependent hydrolase (beta-lactamase superfamily II)
MTSTLRIMQPYPGVFAYYDGRILGKRLHGADPNWLDDGAYGLGIASYAVVDNGEALVCDTHISEEHGKFIRSHLESLGVTRIRVALTHFHNDHIAGMVAFADCAILAPKRTCELLAERRDWITSRKPIIRIVEPTHPFENQIAVTVGRRTIELRQYQIHSEDHAVLWLPDDGILLAGDSLEDPATYIAEPACVVIHIAELRRLQELPIKHILPAHGDPERIANGGYDVGFIASSIDYLERLTAVGGLELASTQSLREFQKVHIESGSSIYFEPYEAVHHGNVAALMALNRS